MWSPSVRIWPLALTLLGTSSCGGPAAVAPPVSSGAGVADSTRNVSAAPGTSCGVTTPLRPIDLRPTESHYVWDVADSPAFWEPRTDPRSQAKFQEFQDWVTGFAPRDQTALLTIQRQAAADLGLSHAVRRHDLLLDQEVGTIEPASCLERFFLVTHLAQFPPSGFPAEYMAHVLRAKQGARRLRIYLSYGDGHTFESHADRRPEVLEGLYSSPPQNPAVLSRVYSDIARTDTWEYVTFLHSHPFMIHFPQPHIGGTVLPSDADIQGWIYGKKHFGMKSAWITNGLQSIRIPAEQFEALGRTLPPAQ